MTKESAVGTGGPPKGWRSGLTGSFISSTTKAVRMVIRHRSLGQVISARKDVVDGYNVECTL